MAFALTLHVGELRSTRNEWVSRVKGYIPKALCLFIYLKLPSLETNSKVAKASVF